MEKPRRAYHLSLDISADTEAALVHDLRLLIDDIERQQRGSVYGSPSSGGHWTLRVDESVTHEAYMAECQKYIDALNGR